jgi:hypothetical protein
MEEAAERSVARASCPAHLFDPDRRVDQDHRSRSSSGSGTSSPDLACFVRHVRPTCPRARGRPWVGGALRSSWVKRRVGRSRRRPLALQTEADHVSDELATDDDVRPHHAAHLDASRSLHRMYHIPAGGVH